MASKPDWTEAYRGHWIISTMVDGTERIQAVLHDREGPGRVVVDCSSVVNAKARISRHVNRDRPPLGEIIRTNAWRARNVKIEVDETFGTVAIGEHVFMEGNEADAFIDEARQLYREAGDVSMDDCYAHLALPYAENTEN